MSATSTSKRIIYKHAESSSNLTLQDALLRIFGTAIKDLMISTPSDKDSFYLISSMAHYTQAKMICGELCLFTPGKHQEIIKLDMEATTCEIASVSNDVINQPDADKRSEFLNSIMYFGVKGNHVILAQSFALQAHSLELYFNKLFKKSGLFNEDDYIRLNDQIDPNEISKVNSADYVKIFSPLETKSVLNGRGEDKSYTLTPTGRLWSALTTFLADVSAISMPQELVLPKKLKSGRIKGELTLKFPFKRNDDDTPFIGELANILRHTDNLEYEIGLASSGGGVMTNKTVKLHKDVTIKIFNSLIDKGYLFAEMIGWLTVLKDKKRILPDE